MKLRNSSSGSLASYSHSDDYELATKIGYGKYSEVYSGFNVLTHERVALKLLKEVNMTKIKREIKIMQAVETVAGVSRFIEVCVEPGTQKVLLATAFVEGVGLSTAMPTLEEKEIKSIVYQILQILAKSNERGVMHRDVKPANMILNKTSNKITLLDWGLAEFYIPDREYFVKVSTRPYKAPELLTGIKKYDYRMDVWSVGCILAAMVLSVSDLAG